MSRGSGPKTASYKQDADYRNITAALAANVRLLRGRRGWTQEEAAAHCGLVPRVFQMIEAGTTNATLVTLVRLARGFGVGAHTLLEGAESG